MYLIIFHHPHILNLYNCLILVTFEFLFLETIDLKIIFKYIICWRYFLHLALLLLLYYTVSQLFDWGHLYINYRDSLTVIAHQLVDIFMSSNIPFLPLRWKRLFIWYITSVCIYFLRSKHFDWRHWPSRFYSFTLSFNFALLYIFLKPLLKNTRSVNIHLLVHWLPEITHLHIQFIFILFLFRSFFLTFCFEPISILISMIRSNTNLINHRIDFCSLFQSLFEFMVKIFGEKAEES